MREITFSPERALESLIYLAHKLAQPTIHELLKLRYFADKLHLSKYGWIASGDEYVAMKFGPVATNTYNLIKAARGDHSPWIHPHFAKLVDGAIELSSGNLVEPLRESNIEMLSVADIECLNEAIRQYGNMEFNDRTELSHDEAWSKAWNAASEASVGACEMPVKDIALTLDNAAEVLEYMDA